MGNENERKRDPAENRARELGHPYDEVKTGGDERNVGQTGDAAPIGGQSAGSGGPVGGSAEFLSGEEAAPRGGPPGANPPEIGAGTKHVLTGDQEGDDNFGGRTGSGTSFLAANTSRADLGASGVGPGGGKPATGGKEKGFIAGRSDEPGGDLEEEAEEDGNPQAGFAEQGQGAPDESEPGGIEGIGERTANRDTDIEGSSTTR